MKIPLDFILVSAIVAVMLAEVGIRRWFDARAARHRLAGLKAAHKNGIKSVNDIRQELGR